MGAEELEAQEKDLVKQEIYLLKEQNKLIVNDLE